MKYFVTGIDTDAGKSIATGMMARYLHFKGVNVITQKLVQTGCIGISEDILTHRRLMGIELLKEDLDGLTCPYVLDFPASPHLSAQLKGVEIDHHKLTACTDKLASKFETIFIEGAGGLMVPLTKSFSLLDYLQICNYPIILVTSAKIGSINHTLLTLEVCKMKQLQVVALVFNHYQDPNDCVATDSLLLFRNKLAIYYPAAKLVEMPAIFSDHDEVDFSSLFQ